MQTTFRILVIVVVTLLGSEWLGAQRLLLLPAGDSLLVLLENDSEVPVVVTNDLGVRSPYERRGLSLSVQDASGRSFPLLAKIDADSMTPLPRVELWPSESLGRRIQTKSIAGFYALSPGKYFVRATYRDPEAKRTIQSETVQIEVTSTKQTKGAEPGATDNPDDPQRLREDH